MYWGWFGIFVFGNVCLNHGLHSSKGSYLEGLASVFCDYVFLVENEFLQTFSETQLAMSRFYILEVFLHFIVLNMSVRSVRSHRSVGS